MYQLILQASDELGVLSHGGVVYLQWLTSPALVRFSIPITLRLRNAPFHFPLSPLVQDRPTCQVRALYDDSPFCSARSTC